MGYRGERGRLEAKIEAQRADLEELRERLRGGVVELTQVGGWWPLRSALRRALGDVEAPAEHDGTVSGLRAAIEGNERVLRRLDGLWPPQRTAHQEWLAGLGVRVRRLSSKYRFLAVVGAGLCVWVLGGAVMWVLFAIRPSFDGLAGIILGVSALVVLGASRLIARVFERFLSASPDASYAVRWLIDVRLGQVTVLGLLVAAMAGLVCGLAWWLG